MTGGSMSFAYEAALQRAIPGAVLHLNMAQTVVDVPCKDCGRLIRRAFHSSNKMPPDKIAKVLRTRGWEIGNRHNKHVCPDQHEPSEPEHLPVINEITVREEEENPMPETLTVSPSDKAKTARRETILLLADVFDVEKGRFKAGESDKSVAAVTGLADSAVAKLREEFYGPLKMPSEIGSIRADLAEALADMERFEQDNADKVRDAKKGLTLRINEIGKRLEAVIEKNGWKT